MVVPEDKKAQTRIALKIIYSSIPRDNYLEGIQWRAIENIVDRGFIVIEQLSIVVEQIKFKQKISSRTYAPWSTKIFKILIQRWILNPS